MLKDTETKVIKLTISFFQKQSDLTFLKLIIKKLYTANTKGMTPF